MVSCKPKHVVDMLYSIYILCNKAVLEYIFIYISINQLIYLLTAIGLTPGGSSTVHVYTQTIHRTTQLTSFVEGFLGFEPSVVKLKLRCYTGLRRCVWLTTYHPCSAERQENPGR